MNSPAPESTPLEATLERYQVALNNLDNSKKPLKKEQALEIFAARDALQKQLEAAAEVPVDLWDKLMVQDARLKEKAYKITQILDLAQYRETLLIADKAWWWDVETLESRHPANR